MSAFIPATKPSPAQPTLRKSGFCAPLSREPEIHCLDSSINSSPDIIA